MARRARAARAAVVTLTSDVGTAYAAQMKAVLARSIDPARVVDLAHDLPAHGVAEAAFLLRAMAVGFPPGTIHVAVVDPGVGGPRAPVVIACADGSLLVGPDNGVLWPLAVALGRPKAYAIARDRLDASPRVGATFDGRDLFAPAAALLARGARASSLGRAHEPVHYEIPEPDRRPGSLRGTVVHVDRFGNVISSIPSAWAPGPGSVVRAAVGRRRCVATVVDHYAAIRPGATGLLGSSFGTLELARREASAARRLGASVGDPVGVAWPVGRTRN